MKELLFSRFETYLLEDMPHMQQYLQDQTEIAQQEERKEYPPGFFTSL